MGREPQEFEGVPKEKVLEILRRSGVEIYETGESMYLLKKETSRGLQEKVFLLPAYVKRRMLHELSHRYDVSIYDLFQAGIIPN